MKDWSDEELSRFLEGLAEGEAEAIGARRASDPAFAARLARLERIVPERVSLPPLAPPVDLAARTLARLEDEALAVRPAAAPADLLARTLGRLETEGLKKPAASTSAPAGRDAAIVAFPARPKGYGFVRAAAVLLATLGLGVATGYLLRGHEVVETIAWRDRVVEKPVVQRVEVPKDVPVEVVKYVDREVVKVVEKEVRVEVPRDVERVVERVVVKEVPVEKEVHVREPATVALVGLAGVERWDAAHAAWRSLPGEASLPAGTLVRGTGDARATVAGKPQRLAERAYVLTGAGSLEPVPEASLVAVGRTATLAATASDAPDVSIPRLLALRESGLPEERATAQHELERRWRERGSPGPGAVASMATVFAGATTEPRPPETAREWNAWWEWARSRPAR